MIVVLSQSVSFFPFTFQTGVLPIGRKTQEGLSLELQNVGRQDAGTYVCTANNGVGEEAHAEIHVDIKCKQQYVDFYGVNDTFSFGYRTQLGSYVHYPKETHIKGPV